MNYGAIKYPDVANGPGVRVSLFVSGCRNHCKGCFQPETWSFDYGKEFTDKTIDYILNLLDNRYVRGLSILGGDPFEPENEASVYSICSIVNDRLPEKDIWIWTGYYWENLKDRIVMKYIDVLVDGPFVEAEKNLCLPYRGSGNQRAIDVKSSLRGSEVITVPFISDMRGKLYL